MWIKKIKLHVSVWFNLLGLINSSANSQGQIEAMIMMMTMMKYQLDIGVNKQEQTVRTDPTPLMYPQHAAIEMLGQKDIAEFDLTRM